MRIFCKFRVQFVGFGYGGAGIVGAAEVRPAHSQYVHVAGAYNYVACRHFHLVERYAALIEHYVAACIGLALSVLNRTRQLHCAWAIVRVGQMVKASNNNNKYHFIMQCFYKIKVYECALFMCQISFLFGKCDKKC